ncbi:MAG: D-tyrosyl-tRNA(Tyr) deacylase [Rhodothermales bacterium]|nr:D-tyrosyl-tRNA(Tyr) deacylase [Rhodothermales bacterium]
MICLIQRVSRAAVSVDGRRTGEIDAGLLILLGVHVTDTRSEAEWLARKCARLRIFPDDDGLMNLSLLDVGGGALVVSQFTLYGDASKGNRPSFIESARPEQAEPLYDAFCELLGEELGTPLATSEFGAMMDVSLVNDGPVTIHLERRSDAS